MGVRILNDLPEIVVHNIQEFLLETGLTLPPTPVVIYEAESLDEFHRLTGKPYSIGGVYGDFQIVIQPVQILKRKGVFIQVLTHELLHWILYGLEEKYQEPLISWWLGLRKDESFTHYLDLNYNGDLALFVRLHWKDQRIPPR
ncbi:MAG: hypothetical protein J7L28_01295 [Thermotogae bacterium]|nr:hypothetical protein [Thermotogota bacterium]